MLLPNDRASAASSVRQSTRQPHSLNRVSPVSVLNECKLAGDLYGAALGASVGRPTSYEVPTKVISISHPGVQTERIRVRSAAASSAVKYPISPSRSQSVGAVGENPDSLSASSQEGCERSADTETNRPIGFEPVSLPCLYTCTSLKSTCGTSKHQKTTTG